MDNFCSWLFFCLVNKGHDEGAALNLSNVYRPIIRLISLSFSALLMGWKAAPSVPNWHGKNILSFSEQTVAQGLPLYGHTNDVATKDILRAWVLLLAALVYLWREDSL